MLNLVSDCKVTPSKTRSLTRGIPATLSKICALPFFIKASSLRLLGLQVIQLFFDYSKNCFTNSFEQSVSLHTGAIMVESSAHLSKQVLEPKMDGTTHDQEWSLSFRPFSANNSMNIKYENYLIKSGIP